MKAQFKYAFRAGLSVRGGVFAVITAMNFVFIALGAMGAMPMGAQITAVSLGGVAIAVMLGVNLYGDIAVARRLFSAPGAYLYALTPAPRRNILMASILTMAVMDLVTMGLVIFGEVWLSFQLAGDGIWRLIWDELRMLNVTAGHVWRVVYTLLLAAAMFLLIYLIPLFCVTLKRSALYHKPAGGLLALLTAFGCVYAVSLTPILLAPFGTVTRFGAFFTVTLGGVGTVLYFLLTFAEVAGLFILTSRLMERKMNI